MTADEIVAGGDGPASTGTWGSMGAVRTAATLVALVVLGVGGIAVLSGGAGARAEPLVGRIAPEIHGRTLDGERIDLVALRGRWVVVNFFAPWCTDCIVEQAALVALQRSVGTDVRLVSVVVDSPVEDVVAFVKRHDADWPFVIDADGRTAVAYGQGKVPETYLIGPDSTIVAKYEGAITVGELEKVITGGDLANRAN